ncbi:MAG: sigma-70 family RNA polymerase sigma factor [Polyangiaceae bacterium]|nr:sigma-70 family RNA polymerase sigma factor [Polyangiaceae bacterium]
MGREMLAGNCAEETTDGTAGSPGSIDGSPSFEAEFDHVWRVLRRLGLSPADADDAAQDVCLVALRRGAEIQRERRRAFLTATAVNVAGTLRRTIARRRLSASAVPDELPSHDLDPEALSLERRRLQQLDEILAGLDWELRAPFVLFELEELTAQEVAELLTIPVGTVASRVRRAREQFREAARRVRARDRTGGVR